MARGFSNALRLALSGVTGGLEGYGAQVETKKRDDELERQRRRQEMLDTLAAVQAGGETLPQRQQIGLGGAANTLAALGGASTGGTAMPMASPELAKLQPPASTITIGKTTFALPSAREKEAEKLASAMRERQGIMTMEEAQRSRSAASAAALANTARERRILSLMANKKTRAEAEAIVDMDAKFGDVFETPNVKATLAGQRNAAEIAAADRASRQYIEQMRINAEKNKADPNAPAVMDFSNELNTIKDFLPTVDANGKIVAPKRKLSGAKSLAVQQGGPAGTFVGQAANLALSGVGADMTNEQLYNTIAEGIATAYAIQEQRGRNVSDRDVANRIAQIKVLPNEVGSLEVQRLKGQRLQAWANRLMTGKIPQINPGETIKPADDFSGSQQFPSFNDWKLKRGK